MKKNSVITPKNKALKRMFFLRPIFSAGRFLKTLYSRTLSRVKGLMSRRPHRSFYLTQKHDSKRRLKIDSYFGFSARVAKLLFIHKWLFMKFLMLYGLFSIIIVGIMSQENFAAFRDAISGVAGYEGFSKWIALFSNAISGGNGSTTDASQQILATILFLYGWLTMVWLLRAIMRGDGEKVKLRDGVYSAGSPIISTLAVALIIVLQLLPFAIVMIAYSSITAVGWINTGIAIENMAALSALVVAGLLTLYWICSSVMALIIVTLPGTYPFVAIKAAGDLIVGRRLKLVYRLLYMMIPVILLWIIVLVPAILIDSWLKLTWQPLVPAVVFALGILTTIWIATYIYMLYREIVDDPSPPVKPHSQNKSTKVSIKPIKKDKNRSKEVK